MNPPNSELRARTTPLSQVITAIESVCTFDHKLPPNTRTSTVWMTHLQMEDDPLFDIFLFDLLSDLQAYQDHIAQLYPSTGHTLNPRLSKRISSVATIRRGLLSARSCSWSRFTEIFDESFRDNLSLLEELAFEEFYEFVIPDHDLESIRDRVRDLVTKVDASSLDPQLKELILRNLRHILSSIRKFEFGTARDLRQTLNSVLAAFYRSHNLFQTVTDPENRTLIGHIGKVIFDFDTLVGHALELPALASQTVQQFPLLPPGT